MNALNKALCAAPQHHADQPGIGDTVEHKFFGRGVIKQQAGRDPAIQFFVQFAQSASWVIAESVKKVSDVQK